MTSNGTKKKLVSVKEGKRDEGNVRGGKKKGI
jgi:hypothetical protein